MSDTKSPQPLAPFRVGEKARVNLPAHLRELAMINQGDVLIVTSVANGEVVIKTPAAIRNYIHSGIIERATDVSVTDWRRDDVKSSEAAIASRLDATRRPDAGAALL